MKVTMCTLTESVQIAGDNRKSWFAGRDGADMWIDEKGLLHIKRGNAHYVATDYGAWLDEAEPKPVKKAKAIEPTP